LYSVHKQWHNNEVITRIVNMQCVNGVFSRRTATRDLRAAVSIPYTCDFITQFCRQQARSHPWWRKCNCLQQWTRL